MKKIICFGIFLLIGTLVFSNDTRIITGKSIEVIDNEDTNVIMLEEEINITLYTGYYVVDVTFDFYNDGPTETILLGFPVDALYQDIPSAREEASLNDHKLYINGDLLAEYTIREEESINNGYVSSSKWFIREVTFPEDSHTFSRVTYRMPYSASSYYSSASYIYGTGRNWKGPIGKMTVNVSHGDDISIYIYFGENKTFPWTFEASGKYKYVIENIEPDLEDKINIGLGAFDINGFEYGNPFSGWTWESELFEENSNKKFFTRGQIRLFVSYFYAKYGYNFENPFYQDHFQRLAAFFLRSGKYETNPDFSEDSFNETERKNIEYLLSIERMIPSDENMQFAEPFIFGDRNIVFEKPDYSINSEDEIMPGNNAQFAESHTLEKEIDSPNKPFIPLGIFIAIFAIIIAIGLFALKHFNYRTIIKKK
jgi:hypothetical protein